MNEYAHIPPPPPPPYVAATPAARRRVPRRWAAVAGVLALGGSVFGVAALGQRGDAASASPLAAAVEGTQAQKTARIDITVEAPGLASPFVTTAEVDFDAGVSHLTVDLAALAGLGDTPKELGTGPIEVRTKGSVAYLKVSGLTELMGGNAKWIKIDASELPASATGASGTVGSVPDAAALLAMLQEQADSFTEVGHADVRGVDTTHYTATIDVARLAREHASSLGDPAVATGAEGLAGTTALVDVWVDADHLVRKVVVHGESAKGAATVTVELSDFGKPVDASVPADADTIDLTALIGNR